MEKIEKNLSNFLHAVPAEDQLDVIQAITLLNEVATSSSSATTNLIAYIMLAENSAAIGASFGPLSNVYEPRTLEAMQEAVRRLAASLEE